MESSLQKIIAAIVGIMILFIIPVYIAFEKADDVSYNLVLKLSQNFVDNVRDKGYISPEMYSDFVSGLYSTNNAYDVEIEHVKKRIEPVIYIYEKSVGTTPGRLLHTLDYATYYNDYLDDGAITIREGIYNEINAIIEENKPEISYNPNFAGGRTPKPDGSISDYDYFIKFKEDNYPDEDTRDYEFYKDYIQQYKEYGRIILSKGDIYADVDTSNYDELIDNPSRISKVAGQIIVDNKQGLESDTLDYETFISKYDAARTLTLSDNTTSDFFDGPIYTQDIIWKKGYMLPKAAKYENYTEEQAEIFYNQHIESYEDDQKDKIVVYEGGVYADKDRLSSHEFVEGVDKPSRFSFFSGTIDIKSGSQIKNENGASYETTLDYDTFIDTYDANEPMVQFAGEIYNDSNSDIIVTKPAMWLGNKTYGELTKSEKDEAETRYSEYIEKLTDGIVIFKEGEIYSEPDSPKKDEITDTIADIDITGTITINNPVGWQPKELSFDEYIEKYRILSSNQKLVVDEGGVFQNGTDGVLIKHTTGKITDANNSEFIIDYDRYIADILDDTKEVISIERKAVYTSSDEILVNFGVKISEKIKRESSEQVDIYSEPEIIEETNLVVDSQICLDIDDYLTAINDNKIIINGIEYDANEIYTDTNIISKQYIIEFDSPSFVELPSKLENGISTSIQTFVQEQVDIYIQEYINNGNISYSAPNIEYTRDELQAKLKYDLEKIDIYSEANNIYTFEEYLNPSLYEEYYEQFYDESNPGSITVAETAFLKSDLTVTYDKININGNQKVIESSDDNFMKYVDDYYTIVGGMFNHRIVIEEYDYATLNGELNVQYPKIEIYDTNHSNGDSAIHVFTEDDYYNYYEEYASEEKITVQPARIYSRDDVNVSRAYIEILPEDSLLSDVRIYDNDTEYDYDDCLSEYEDSYRVTLSQPEWYYKSDVEVIHPHIAIGKKTQTLPIYKIYEYASIDGSSADGNVNKGLYDRYTKEFERDNKVTIIYSVNDVTVYRKYININLVDRDDFNVVIGNKKIYDNSSSPKYNKAHNEWQTTGKITYAGARQYFAEGNQINVTEPSVVIRDPNTNNIILKYEGNYDFSLLEEEIYKIYDERSEEYNQNLQLVEKKTTYKHNDNCIMEIGHIVNEEVITDKQIVDKLFTGTTITKVEFLRNCMLGNGDMYKSLSYLNDNSYSMNEGDQINIRVKNSNQTIASIFYSMLTASVGNDEVAKIYVNYGGTIKNNGEDIIEEINGNVETEVGRIFKYTGSAQEITLDRGIYEIQCWGASGGGTGEGSNYSGGKGAYAKATFDIQEAMTLYVYVGGEGTEYSDTNINNGGFNGGGNSYNGFGGGGATDVRLKKGNWNDNESLLTRIIVAGGGGGSSKKTDAGNYGFGGYAGNRISASNGAVALGVPETSPKIGKGALRNQISVGYYYIPAMGSETLPDVEEEENGSLGTGGSVDYDGAGGGGAGYFGGSAAHYDYAGGGGGLSYIYMNDLASQPASLLNTPFAIELANLSEYILPTNVFKNIMYLGTYPYAVKTGNEIMENPLKYLGYEDMTGNKGNGYVIIKKK